MKSFNNKNGDGRASSWNRTTLGEVDYDLLYLLVGVIARVHKVGDTELASSLLLGRIDVNADDARSTGHLSAHDGSQADCAEAVDTNSRALLNLFAGVSERLTSGRE